MNNKKVMKLPPSNALSMPKSIKAKKVVGNMMDSKMACRKVAVGRIKGGYKQQQ